MDLFVLLATQLAVGAGFAFFYLKQDARVRVLERRVTILTRRREAYDLSPTPAEPREAIHPASAGVRLELRTARTESEAVRTTAPPTVANEGVPSAELPVERDGGSMERILHLAHAGQSSADIARATGRGRGEVDLLLQLYRLDRRAAGQRSTSLREGGRA